MLLDFGCVKSAFVLTFFAQNFVSYTITLWITSLRREKILLIGLYHVAKTNYLKVYHLFINDIYYICIEFCENCNVIYRVRNILFRNTNFLHVVLPLKWKNHFLNINKRSESMTKHIEIIILKFETLIFNIQRVMDIFKK